MYACVYAHMRFILRPDCVNAHVYWSEVDFYGFLIAYSFSLCVLLTGVLFMHDDKSESTLIKDYICIYIYIYIYIHYLPFGGWIFRRSVDSPHKWPVVPDAFLHYDVIIFSYHDYNVDHNSDASQPLSILIGI